LGALVAAVNRKVENVVPTVVAMLQELQHRGSDSHGIATPNATYTASSIQELPFKDLNSAVALGHNLSAILPRDQPQPIQGDGFTIVFEGRTYPSPNLPNLPEVKEIAEKLGGNPLQRAVEILEKQDGSYVFVIAEGNKVIVGRDIFGATPLYYSQNKTLCAVASERKALWKLGLEDPKSFPPGQLATIDSRGFSFLPIKKLHVPPKEKINLDTAARALETLLLESTRKRVSDLDSVAVAFSGGVDSSVVAVLAQHVGLEVQLVSVGLENQPEVMFTQQAAEALELPIHIQTYTTTELEKNLQEVLWLTEERHTVNTCIAVPFFWLAETASKLGYPVLLAGQGADELFGGYQRYLTEYAKLGAEAVEKTMFYDIENAYAANFQRDNQVCAHHGIELRLPFIDPHVVDFAMRLPLRHKINSTEDKLRKRILRRTAQNLDIPSFLADKPKKAVQYTTGVTKALQRLAKNDGLTLRRYIERAFHNVYTK
jgi:asparagine synthase (glutamine-hydrolysing)